MIRCNQGSCTLIPPTGYTIQQFNDKLYDRKNKTKRRYVREALYKDAIDTKSRNIVDCTDEPIELRVILDDGSQSIVKVVNLNFEEKVMEQLIVSGTKLSNSKGNARQKSGDNGEMYGIGRRAGGGKHGFNLTPMFDLCDPESKSYDKKFTESFCVAARSFSKMVKRYFPNLSMKYKEIEKKNDIDIKMIST